MSTATTWLWLGLLVLFVVLNGLFVAAEYALILAIVGSAIALAAIGLGTAISTRMNKASNCIASTNSTQYTTNCT